MTGSQSKISFSTMNEEFIDARFDPEYRRLYKGEIEKFDLNHEGRSYEIMVKFNGDVDNTTKLALQSLISEIFLNVETFGLRLEHVTPVVHFFTPHGWRKQNGGKTSQDIQLPAAKISWDPGTPVIQVIIPESIKSNEIVIKAVRLLCSKLFGKLFFEEHVPLKERFKNLPNEISEKDYEIVAKTRFCRFMNRFSIEALEDLKILGKNKGIGGTKQEQQLKAELYRELINNPTPTPDTVQIIDSNFRENLDILKADNALFFDQLTNKIFEIAPQTTIILPHEFKNYHYLKISRQWMIFHALEEKSQLISNIYNELNECISYLQTIDPHSEIDFELNRLWCKTLNERIISLKKKQLVKEFLIDNAQLSNRQQHKKASFPLWIWQKDLVKNFPKGTSTDKIIKRTTEQYKNSIYHKLLETASRLIACFKQIEETPIRYVETTNAPRLKLLISWLDFRIDGVVDLLHTCQISTDLSSLSTPQKINKKKALSIYEKGWSYFISFALIHQYYLKTPSNQKKKDRRSDQFIKLIENYILDRVEKEATFRVAELLISFYQEKNYNLKDVVNLLREESNTLDFFVIQQAELFGKNSGETREIIKNYSRSLQKWKMERYKHKINLPGEQSSSIIMQ